jgi:hypothetical protein
MRDFPIIGSFFLLNSNSNEPSRTISISPRVPRIGKIAVRFGISIFKKTESCLIAHPNNKRIITAGILVFEDVKSKKYAIKNKQQMIIIIVVVIPYLPGFFDAFC